MVLVALHGRLGFGLLQLGLGRLQLGAAAVQLYGADKALRLQGRKTLPIGLGQIALGLRRLHLCLGRLRTQGVILGIKLGQQLACRHRLPQLGRALQQLTGDTKPQTGLGLGAHLSGKTARCLCRMGLHLQQLDRPDRLWGHGLARARRQHQAQAQPNNPRSQG